MKRIAPGPEGGRPRGYPDYVIKRDMSQVIFEDWIIIGNQLK